MIGAGALAALTVIGAGLVRFPAAGGTTAADTLPAPDRSTTVKRPVRYVHLKRGQKAPAGAKVIQEAAPKPRIVVRTVPAAPTSSASRSATTTRPVAARTRQSGA